MAFESTNQDQLVVFEIWSKLKAFSISTCCIDEYNSSLVELGVWGIQRWKEKDEFHQNLS